MLMAVVYKITNNINGKIYVGQSKNSAEYRFNQHFREARSKLKHGKTNVSFHNAIVKYGKESFSYEVLEEIDDIQLLNEREIYWIKYLNSNDRNIGYNIGDGGSNTVMSEHTRSKIRAKTSERWEDEEMATIMREGLSKATEKWQNICREKRLTKTCKSCGCQYDVAEWDKDRVYCSLDCKDKDIQSWLKYDIGLDKAKEANIEYRIDRHNQIRNVALDWAINNPDKVMYARYNKIMGDIAELFQVIEDHFGIVDARTVSIAVCQKGKGSKKLLLDELKNCVKMYAVPDQNRLVV